MANIARNSRPQEGNGHLEEHRLSEVRQADPHCETGQRPRARRSAAESISPARPANSTRSYAAGPESILSGPKLVPFA